MSTSIGPASLTLDGSAEGLKAVRFLGFPSPVVPPLFTAGSTPSVPRLAPSPSVAPHSSLLAFLPVRSSPRRPWPPPTSARECGSVGSPWICLGKCSCPCLPRSWPSRLLHRAPVGSRRGRAVDTTLVSVLRRDGTPHPRSANEDGAALAQARRRKELRHPELGQHGRAKLVVLASEVGGRWSEECRQFLCQLASDKPRNEPKVLSSRARQAWLRKWGLPACLLAVRLARSQCLFCNAGVARWPHHSRRGLVGPFWLSLGVRLRVVWLS